MRLKRGKGLSEEISGRFALGLKHGSIVGDPKTLFALPGGSSLQAQQIYLIGGIDQTPDATISFLEIGLLGCRFTFSLADADSFLQENIAQEQLSAPYDIVVAWDSQQGIHFKGSIGLEGDFSLNANFGPIYLEKLSMAVKPQDERFDIEASTSGQTKLRPLDGFC